MRVLLDTNVLLDVLLKREPWVLDSSEVWQAHDEGQITGYVMACAITDIFYVARRLTSLEVARRAVDICLKAFEICAVDRQTLEQAQVLSGRDFEDDVQVACSTLANLDAIVTRNVQDFAVADIPVLTPAEMILQLGQR